MAREITSTDLQNLTRAVQTMAREMGKLSEAASRIGKQLNEQNKLIKETMRQDVSSMLDSDLPWPRPAVEEAPSDEVSDLSS